MSIVRELERFLTLALLVAVVALGGYAWVQSKRTQAAQETAYVQTGNARAATVYVTAHKAVQKEKDAKYAEMEKALQGHADWADAPVPDDVANVLRHRTGTTRAVP